MLQTLVIGEHGEAALLAFDHRMDVIQDFTNDGALFTKALEKLTPGGSQFHRRRLRVLRDPHAAPPAAGPPADSGVDQRDQGPGQRGRIRDALLEAEINNVIIYSININRAIAALTTSSGAPRPDPFPPAAHSMPGIGPQTPHAIGQLRGDESMHFEPVFMEIFTQVKAIFVPNHAEILTEYTGGREYSFTGLKSLEQAVTDLGEELHSQYILSYTPSNTPEGGFHKIRVEVNRPGLDVRARKGYWMASKPQAN